MMMSSSMMSVTEETQVRKSHKLVVNNRKTSLVTGVLDVLSFDLNEILLETEQGMMMVKGSDLHVNRLSLEKGEVDLSGNNLLKQGTIICIIQNHQNVRRGKDEDF